jgi:hypothetical protein
LFVVGLKRFPSRSLRERLQFHRRCHCFAPFP